MPAFESVGEYLSTLKMLGTAEKTLKTANTGEDEYG